MEHKSDETTPSSPQTRLTQLSSANINNCTEQSGGFNDNDFNSYESYVKMYIIYHHVLNMMKNQDDEVNLINYLFGKIVDKSIKI